MKWFDNTALTLVIIGAINWLLIGIFSFDLVAFLFGNLSWLSRIIYTIVGLCGLYLISWAMTRINRIKRVLKKSPLSYFFAAAVNNSVISLYNCNLFSAPIMMDTYAFESSSNS